MTPRPLHTVNGRPLLYGTLGATFQLQSVEDEDEARFEQVHALILEWFGDQLRWSAGSPFAETQRFRPRDLEFVSCYPRQLRLLSRTGDRLVDDTGTAIDELGVQHFRLALHGGKVRHHASPWGYRFFSVVAPGSTTRLETRTVLHVYVPEESSHVDFRSRVVSIAERLRLRWGVAGLVFGEWKYAQQNQTANAIYAFARRYPGYDVGLYEQSDLLLAWHDQIRTVSWLTFVGSELRDRLCGAGNQLEGNALLLVSKCPEWTLIEAGTKPEAGDGCAVPRSYVSVDAALKPLRATGGLNFAVPWSEATTTAWLRRFECDG